MADYLSPLPPQAQPVQLNADGEPSAQLPAGRRVSAVVEAQLETSSGTYRYQLTILRQTLQVQAARSLMIGSVLDLIPVYMPGGVLNLISNEEAGRQVLQVLPAGGEIPAEAPPRVRVGGAPLASTREDAAAPTHATTIASDRMGQALRDAGLSNLPREQLDVLTARLANLQLAEGSAARATARLVTLGAPLTDGLLRGGALAESTAPGRLDLPGALAELLTVARDVLGDGAGARALLARFDAILAALQGASAGTPSSLARPPVLALHGLLEDLVSTVLRNEPLLAGIRAEQAQLVRAARVSVEGDLEARVARLLARPGGDGAGPLEPLGNEARRQALELLQSLERDAVERHQGIRRLQPTLQQLYARLEVAQYLQLTEWLSLGRDDSDNLGAGLWGGPPERLPLRFTVRDERHAGGDDSGVGFRIEIDSPSLGALRVAGRLNPKPGEPAELNVHLAAADATTRVDLEAQLPELHALLEEREYRPTLSVGGLKQPTPETPTESEADDRLDISA